MNINTDMFNNIIVSHKGKSLDFGSVRYYTRALFSSYLNIINDYLNSMDDERLARIFVIYNKLHDALSLKERDDNIGFKSLIMINIGSLIDELNNEGMIETFLGKDRVRLLTETKDEDRIHDFCDSHQLLKLIELSILTRALIPIFNMYIKIYHNEKYPDEKGTKDYMLLYLLKNTPILNSDILQHLKYLLNKKYELLDLDGPNTVSKCVVIITIADIVIRILPLIDLNKQDPLFPVYKRIYHDEINAASINVLFKNTKLIG